MSCYLCDTPYEPDFLNILEDDTLICNECLDDNDNNETYVLKNGKIVYPEG